MRLRSYLQTRRLLYMKGLLPAAISPQMQPIFLEPDSPKVSFQGLSKTVRHLCATRLRKPSVHR